MARALKVRFSKVWDKDVPTKKVLCYAEIMEEGGRKGGGGMVRGGGGGGGARGE